MNISYSFKKNNLSIQIELKASHTLLSKDLAISNKDIHIQNSDFILDNPKNALFYQIQHSLFSSYMDNLFDSNIENPSLNNLITGAILEDNLISSIKNHILQRLSQDSRFKIQNIIIQGITL